MLDKGIIERIVLDYKDIYKQALEDNLQSPAELPYFEGDFWPNVLEENIRELEQVIFDRYITCIAISLGAINLNEQFLIKLFLNI